MRNGPGIIGQHPEAAPWAKPQARTTSLAVSPEVTAQGLASNPALLPADEPLYPPPESLVGSSEELQPLESVEVSPAQLDAYYAGMSASRDFIDS